MPGAINPAQTVLILDDNPAFVRAITLAAEASGLAVIATEEMDEFASFLDRPGIAAAIVDCLLGDHSGLAILGTIAAHRADLPTLVVSGYGETMLAQAEQIGRRHGLQRLSTLPKPFSMADLRRFLVGATAAQAA
ncbi:response regulator [Elioraea sp.]|uniref:response regulator n=1 Tax=Elioraea sp. TaxID=2185103 RepID=UPI0025BB1B8F|nr:response regulator [Elioraea sp.]